jgi:hypothetical protein
MMTSHVQKGIRRFQRRMDANRRKFRPFNASVNKRIFGSFARSRRKLTMWFCPSPTHIWLATAVGDRVRPRNSNYSNRSTGFDQSNSFYYHYYYCCLLPIESALLFASESVAQRFNIASPNKPLAMELIFEMDTPQKVSFMRELVKGSIIFIETQNNQKKSCVHIPRCSNEASAISQIIKSKFLQEIVNILGAGAENVIDGLCKEVL